MKKQVCSSLLIALSLISVLYADLDGKRIDSITLLSKEPSSKFDPQTILSRLQSHEGDLFSQEQFDRDLKELARDYDEVMPKVVESEGQLQIELTLSAPSTIEAIHWRGNSAFSTSSLMKELGLQKGQLLDRGKLSQGLAKIRQYYVKRGYFQAKVSYQLQPLEPGRVELKIQLEEGIQGRIHRIHYRGFDPSKLAQQDLILQPYQWLTSWYTGRGQYIEEALEVDRNKLTHLLQDEGYADARVESQLKQLNQGKKGLEIEFQAVPGALYRVRQITLEGVEKQPREKVEKLIELKSGDLYSPSQLRQSAERIKQYYGSKGYSDLRVRYQPVLVDPESQLYDLQFQVEEGAQYRVGRVRFTGNYTTRPRVMMHESLMVPGQLLSQRKLESTERRLMNTGYFKSVHVRTSDSHSFGSTDGHYKDVIIDVEEIDSTTKLSLQLGATMEEGIYGSFGAKMENFYWKGLSRLRRDGLRAIRGNGENLSFSSHFSHRTQQHVLSWTDPYFLESPWSFGIDLDRRLEHQKKPETYYARSQGITFYGYYPLNDFLRLKLSQSLRDEHLRLSPSLAQSDEARDAARNGIYSTQSAALLFDSTNRFQLPTQGLRSSLSLSLTEGPTTFARLSYQNAYYLSPLHEKGTFKIRLEADTLRPLGRAEHPEHEGVPLNQRLYLGGEETLRGYQSGLLGKRDSKGKALGGISRLIGSVEYLYRINPTLSLFVFSDNGSISDRSFRMGKNYHSLGYGVRLDVAGGFPIVFGMGYPQTEKGQRAIVRHFFFSIGDRF